MLSCLFCNAPFRPNQTLEHFPTSTRVAHDPFRGRLWAVCEACQRWTLAPMESRWEALEELEQLLSGRARLLSQTENVALLFAGDVEIVRVGRAPLREEAWWRYGKQAYDRKRESERIVRWGHWREALTSMVVIGIPVWGWRAAATHIDRARKDKFGSVAWQERQCELCGKVQREVRFSDPVVLEPVGGLGYSLNLSCRCGALSKGDMPAAQASRLLRRLLAYHNFAGATEIEVSDATSLIERQPSPAHLLHQIAEARTPLVQLDRVRLIALEIAANESSEAEALAAEVRALEDTWRREEEIASIADGELTPLTWPRARKSGNNE